MVASVIIASFVADTEIRLGFWESGTVLARNGVPAGWPDCCGLAISPNGGV
jgi:hypothetical protein